MGLFTQVIKKGAKVVDGLLDDTAEVAVKEFDEAAWLKENPRPEGPSRSTPVNSWLTAKRKAKQRAEGPPTRNAPNGYDSLGNPIVPAEEVRWLKENPRPFPGVLRKNFTPEQNKVYKKWDYELQKHRHGQQHFRDANKRSYDANKEEIANRRKTARANRTPEQIEMDRAAEQLRRQDPEYVDSSRKRGRDHYQNNKEMYSKKTREREGMIVEQTPAHYSSRAVKEIYRRAAELSEATGQKYVVDHVVPLKGHVPGSKLGVDANRSVSGLNVQDNLLIVPENLNASKGGWMAAGDDPMTMNEVARRRLLQQAEEGLLGPIK